MPSYPHTLCAIPNRPLVSLGRRSSAMQAISVRSSKTTKYRWSRTKMPLASHRLTGGSHEIRSQILLSQTSCKVGSVSIWKVRLPIKPGEFIGKARLQRQQFECQNGVVAGHILADHVHLFCELGLSCFVANDLEGAVLPVLRQQQPSRKFNGVGLHIERQRARPCTFAHE